MAKRTTAAAVTTTATELPLFDRIVGATPDEIKQERNKLLRNTIRRSIRSGHDSAVGKRLDSVQKLTELKRNIESFDVNAILSKAAEIENIDKTIERTKALWREMFGEEMATVED